MPGSITADPEHPQTMPYKAEYARSGRSTCKKCNKLIPEGELRIATQVKSRLFEGMQQNWQHVDCFFIRNRPTNSGDIDNFENLRYEDQERIEKKFDELHSREMTPEKHMLVSDFKVEYPKSGKSMCPVCENYINQHVPRIGMVDYESENSRRFGPHFKWHHVDCFVKARDKLGYTASGEQLQGFSELEPSDQDEIRDKLPQQEGHVSEKKPKREVSGEPEQMETGSSEQEEQEQMELEGTQKEESPKKATRRNKIPPKVSKGKDQASTRGETKKKSQAKEEDAQKQLLEEHARRGRKGQTVKKEESQGKAKPPSKGAGRKASPAKKGVVKKGPQSKGSTTQRKVRKDQEEAMAEQQADEEQWYKKAKEEQEEGEKKKPARGRGGRGGTKTQSTGKTATAKGKRQGSVTEESPPAKKMKSVQKPSPTRRARPKTRLVEATSGAA